MRVNVYEQFWMYASGVMIALFLGMIIYVTVATGARPPSNVETIDPATVMTDPRFENRGVATNADGSTTVTVVALTFAFLPAEFRVPAGQPVTFRLTSIDVVHGFQIVGTNANAIVVPGYVSQFTITFEEPGEYLIVCNEYCGSGHHVMYGKLIVEGS